MKKRIICIFFTCFLSVSLSGCLGHWLGIYVNQPGPGDEGRYSETFDLSYDKSFEAVVDIAREMNLSVFEKDKPDGEISLMRFDKMSDKYTDTTEVGVYFFRLNDNKTQVDVACGRASLAEVASKRIFQALRNQENQ